MASQLNPESPAATLYRRLLALDLVAAVVSTLRPVSATGIERVRGRIDPNETLQIPVPCAEYGWAMQSSGLVRATTLVKGRSNQRSRHSPRPPE